MCVSCDELERMGPTGAEVAAFKAPVTEEESAWLTDVLSRMRHVHPELALRARRAKAIVDCRQHGQRPHDLEKIADDVFQCSRCPVRVTTKREDG